MRKFSLIEFTLSICLLSILSVILYQHVIQQTKTRYHVHALQKESLEAKSWIQHMCTLIKQAEQCELNNNQLTLQSEDESLIKLNNGQVLITSPGYSKAFFSDVKTLQMEVIHHENCLQISDTFTPSPEQTLPIALRVTVQYKEKTKKFSFFFKRSHESAYKVSA